MEDPLFRDAEALLSHAVTRAAALGLARASSSREPHVLRVLLLRPGRAWVDEAVVLEVHRWVSRAAAPLFIAALTRFRRPMPRAAASASFASDDGLDTWLAHGSVYDARRILLSRWARPTTYAGALFLRAWPLLGLESPARVDETAVAQLGQWLAEVRPARAA